MATAAASAQYKNIDSPTDPHKRISGGTGRGAGSGQTGRGGTAASASGQQTPGGPPVKVFWKGRYIDQNLMYQVGKKLLS